ncbi:hypothetical protein [Aureispira anguillae]|uniref:Uncharacterized protein n=1 Tax=Aureispira anguillae TaxID=2864201 RepID=A0A915YE40_9BACT|nr:hypothetical protein [Aureispira anguillae]BDS11435.1 hypothetical protein AsAng_0021490 [Aureispira anguillae]
MTKLNSLLFLLFVMSGILAQAQNNTSLNELTNKKLIRLKDTLSQSSPHSLAIFEKIIHNREKIALNARTANLNFDSLSAVYILEVYSPEAQTVTVYERYYYKDAVASTELPLGKKALINGAEDPWWDFNQDPINAQALPQIKARFKILKEIDYSFSIIRKVITTMGCDMGIPHNYYKRLKRKEKRKLGKNIDPKTHCIETLIQKNETLISFQNAQKQKPEVVIWVRPY